MADDELDDLKRMMKDGKRKPQMPLKKEAADSLQKAAGGAKAAAEKSGYKVLKSAAEAAKEQAEAAAAVPGKAAAAAGGFMAEHTVVSGDNLSAIAGKYYGSQVNWKKIYEANKELIGDNPSLIRVGQVLKIPKMD